MKKTLFYKVSRSAQTFIKDWFRSDASLGDVVELVAEMEGEGRFGKDGMFERAVFRKLQAAYPEAEWQYAHAKAPGIKVGIDIGRQIAVLFFNAGQLSNAKMMGLLGKLYYLSHYAYGDGILVLAYGEEGLRHHPSIKEMEELAESLRCGFHYFAGNASDGGLQVR